MDLAQQMIQWNQRLDGHRGTPSNRRFDEVFAHDQRVRIGVERPELDAERAVVGERDRAVVDRRHDAVGPAPVARPAVDREGEVCAVTACPGHAIAAFRIDRREPVERIGVVSAPFQRGRRDLDHPRSGAVGPEVALQRDREDLGEPLVALDDGDLIGHGPVALEKGLVDVADEAQQFVERVRGLVVGSRSGHAR